MEPKDYYVVADRGPIKVNGYIESGYKVIGKSKLWNPNPLPVTYTDIDLIRQKLPEWLAKHYPDYNIEIDFSRIPVQELLCSLKYKFSILHTDGMGEGDLYLLQLTDGKKNVDVYIPKARIYNFETDRVDTVLVYPFFDAEWHGNIDDDSPFRPGDPW